jgi:hypothetical protein
MSKLTSLLSSQINGLGDSSNVVFDPDALSSKKRARFQCATWIKATNPELYQAALNHAESWRKKWAAAQGDPGTLSGLGADSEPSSFWAKFSEGLTSLATGVLAYKTQKQILEANIDRANQGLPPIDMAAGAPVVKTQIDLSPEVAARLQETGLEAVKKVLLYGGLAVAGIFLLTRKGKGRR